MSPVASAVQEWFEHTKSLCQCSDCFAQYVRIYRALVFAEAAAASMHADDFARIWAYVVRVVDENVAAAQAEVDAELSTKH